MDYIQYAIEQLEKNNHGISAGRARDEYLALKNRLAHLEAAEQQRAVDVCWALPEPAHEWVRRDGIEICLHCKRPRS